MRNNPRRFPTKSPHLSNPLSNCLHNLVSTLGMSKLCSSDVIYRDEYQLLTGKSADQLLRRTIESKPVDAVVYDFMHDKNNPSIETLQLIKSKGIRLVCIWFDTRNADNTATIIDPSYANVSDLNVAMDQIINEPGWIYSFTPQDPTIFFDANLPRDINLSFVGNTRRCKQRSEILEQLKHLPRQTTGQPYVLRRPTRSKMYYGSTIRQFSNSSVLIQHTSQGSPQKLSPQQYARFFQRSKMSINIGSGLLKGRPFEICHCGALLFSDSQHTIDPFLLPETDYVPFNTAIELIDKFRYYQAHDQERAQIAANGHKKVINQHNSINFWRRILGMEAL